MRQEITSLDLHYLVKELQVLVNGKVDKIYEKEDDKKELLIRFHVPEKGNKQLKILVPNYVYLTEYKEEYPQMPPGYCMFLRKYLTNSRLIEIKQVNFERIIELTFQTKTEKLTLIIELFSKGNVILCKEDKKIMSPLENQNWKDRTIRGGIKYEYPPKQTNTKEITNISTNKEIVKYLATDLGFGGLYSEYLCKISNIDKNKTKLEDKEKKILLKNIQQIFNQEIKANKKGEEILPIEIEKADTYYENFSKALDENLTRKEEKDVVEKKHKEQQTKKDKIMKDQEQRIKGLELSTEENKKKGEAIYEHYQELNEILTKVRELRKNNVPWAEIKKRFKEIKINEKEGTITINI